MDDRIYPHAWGIAVCNGEEEQYISSRNLNHICACRLEVAIEKDKYEENFRYLKPATLHIIESFGFPRVLWVLANAAQLGKYAQEISPDNRAWAGNLVAKYLDKDFIFDIDPQVLDHILTRVRRAHVAMMADVVGHYEESHHIAERNRMTWHHTDMGDFIPNPGVTEKHLKVRYEEVVSKTLDTNQKRREAQARRRGSSQDRNGPNDTTEAQPSVTRQIQTMRQAIELPQNAMNETQEPLAASDKRKTKGGIEL